MVYGGLSTSASVLANVHFWDQSSFGIGGALDGGFIINMKPEKTLHSWELTGSIGTFNTGLVHKGFHNSIDHSFIEAGIAFNFQLKERWLLSLSPILSNYYNRRFLESFDGNYPQINSWPNSDISLGIGIKYRLMKYFRLVADYRTGFNNMVTNYPVIGPYGQIDEYVSGFQVRRFNVGIQLVLY
jgi:hypothetical protein